MIGNIARQTIERQKLNILAHTTHERYSSVLCQTGHNFWLFDHPHCKRWIDKYYPLPPNFHFLPTAEDKISRIPRWLDLDLVLIESIFGHHEIMLPHAIERQIPTVRLEHTTTLGWPKQRVDNLRRKSCDINVFISQDSVEKWGFQGVGRVIEHGIDVDKFKPGNRERKNHIVVVANDYRNRGYILGFDIFDKIVHGLPTRLIGDTEGLSKPAASFYELISYYQEGSIFLNTSRMSPIPMSLLEAASCGLGIVTTSTCEIPNIFKHGETALMSNNVDELRDHLIFLLENPSEARRLGDNARQMIIKRFHKDRFVQEWNDLFAEAAALPFTGIYP